uniref:beta-ketoacyl-[acyl-carrier-protein] synthase III n=1 Tax=Opuntia streptacantha TaxID=393608 RepID=A0A7C9FQP8_OPUST
MASAYGLFSSSVPTYLKHRISPSIGQNGSGFSSYPGISKRVFCSTSSSVEGAVSPTELQVPRLVSKGCKLVGCGSAVPKLQISNDDLASVVETSDEWIATRTGIRKRRVLSGEESLVSLATEAAQKALQMAQVDPDDIDLVLMCSSTPEDLFGSAPQVQRALGCSKNPLSYDITAACSGFVLGLLSAACHVRGGGFKNVLVIGADGLSRFVDWSDRGTCILFGDGAGAVVMQACDSEEDGLFAFDVNSDGDGTRHLNASLRHDETNGALVTNGSVVGFPPRRPAYSCINMNGKEVFRFAVRCVPLSIEAALQKAGLSVSNIDWLLLHQANQRIIDAVATRLEFPPERVISNLAHYGNTSAASIPLALDEAVRRGDVKPGHVIAASGFGAGLTWGSAILRWG